RTCSARRRRGSRRRSARRAGTTCPCSGRLGPERRWSPRDCRRSRTPPPRRAILFLAEARESPRDVLDALRQPLESGEVVIARAGTQAVFPARFTLVLAANPCPCAKAAGPGRGWRS